MAYWLLREGRPTGEPSSNRIVYITKIFDLIIRYEDGNGAKRKHIFTTVERKGPVQIDYPKLEAVTNERFAAAESSLAKAQETIGVMKRQISEALGNTKTGSRGHDATSGAESRK
ncbi:MAG: hypothetical protein Q9165_002719 [Trypethelium subeluteriae]